MTETNDLFVDYEVARLASSGPKPPSTAQLWGLLHGFEAALRAVTAERDENERILILLRHQRDKAETERDALREFVEAHDAVEHLIADHTDDRAAYNAAVDRLNAARKAIAHATETNR